MAADLIVFLFMLSLMALFVWASSIRFPTGGRDLR